MHDGALRGVAAGCVVAGCVVAVWLLGAAALGVGDGDGSTSSPSSAKADVPRQRWLAPDSTGVFYTFDGQLRWTDATYPGAGLPVGR